MKFSVAFAIGLAALPGLASASFAATCKDWFWSDRHKFVATCKKADGTWRRTRQDMNLCLGRSGDVIVSENNGKAFESPTASGKQACIFSHLSGSVLTVGCNNGMVNLPINLAPSSIDLNTVLHNGNGFLQCHGHNGAPY
ncbi:hypothetical protein QBC35DRAFT_454937 [Podospora australis]|uniref:Cyanovirin-N domain-containing protein n=1 Tax=Podospora australis TaxID=1536484 RepID=A0AAN6WMN9_9PEZI|nr:hypothetical protein QBC35DRAFT_454937 [Podospora australis]